MRKKIIQKFMQKGAVLGLIVALGASSSFAGVREDLLDAAQWMVLKQLEHLEKEVLSLAEQQLEDPGSFQKSTSDPFQQLKKQILAEVFKELENAQLIEKYAHQICSRDEKADTLHASLKPCFCAKSTHLAALDAFIFHQFDLHHWKSEEVFETLKKQPMADTAL